MEIPTVPPEHPQGPVDLLPGRRSVLGWLTYGLGAVAAAVLGIPVIRFFLGVPKQPDEWVPLGTPESFPLDQTRLKEFDNPIRQPWDGEAARTQVYVRNLGKNDKGELQFLVLGVNCAHLGCPVAWFPEAGLFMCPCHGGVYYATGERASGPPPRGLFKANWKIEAGQLKVRAPHYPTLQNTLSDSDKTKE